jgi:hypothetical protein
MATNVRIVLNRSGLGRILKGQEGTLKHDLDHRGRAIADRANAQSGSGKVDLAKSGDAPKVNLSKPGDSGRLYESEGRVGKARYRNTVRSTRPVVISHSPLLRSIDAGRHAG